MSHMTCVYLVSFPRCSQIHTTSLVLCATERHIQILWVKLSNLSKAGIKLALGTGLYGTGAIYRYQITSVSRKTVSGVCVTGVTIQMQLPHTCSRCPGWTRIWAVNSKHKCRVWPVVNWILSPLNACPFIDQRWTLCAANSFCWRVTKFYSAENICTLPHQTPSWIPRKCNVSATHN